MPAAKKDATKEILHYIENLPEWSKKICNRLRQIILRADPSLTEEWKWGPHYSSNGMVCGYGAFQKHVKFTFFNGSAMKDAKSLFNHCVDNEFSRSIKFTSETELDEKLLSEYIKESVAVNQKGYKRTIKDKTVEVPEDLQHALSKNKKAQTFFDGLSYGYKKEFAEYITTAKQDNTRIARITKVIDYCKEEKKLNDKYKKDERW